MTRIASSKDDPEPRSSFNRESQISIQPRDDDDDTFRPFYWYDRDYNIPDECKFYQ